MNEATVEFGVETAHGGIIEFDNILETLERYKDIDGIAIHVRIVSSEERYDGDDGSYVTTRRGTPWTQAKVR